MQELTNEHYTVIGGGASRELFCSFGYTSLGTLTGVLIGGVFTGGVGAIKGGKWGFTLGVAVADAVCYR